ncbi:MAG: GHKL domain-containing protein, partial [Alphaproteobacteria bacterium]|nr:GHKL domain-containing protein [Alphaproteobacteria bacterium]
EGREKPKALKNVSPELGQLMVKVTDFVPYFEQIVIERDGRSRTLQVCVVPEANLNVSNASLPHNHVIGYVVTFDDITSLVSAQRKAAWSDVARRIAHEIKNPLTPIQLSAERLKRRYLKEIQSDPEIFIGCIDTIIRQVSHIGKLVGEFSSFARMPEPDLKMEDLSEICRQSVFLQQEAHKDVVFNVTIPSTSVPFICDSQQLSQVLTNLLQNALDVLENKDNKSISLSLATKNKDITIIVADNGPGFPLQNRERLLEPYVTTRSKGTGLGLAIVAKIVEDHGGTLELTNSPVGGAAVILRFASVQNQARIDNTKE